MGWREFQLWLREIQEQNEAEHGTHDDPGSWDDAKSRENFDELDEKRRKMRGR